MGVRPLETACSVQGILAAGRCAGRQHRARALPARRAGHLRTSGAAAHLRVKGMLLGQRGGCSIARAGGAVLAAFVARPRLRSCAAAGVLGRLRRTALPLRDGVQRVAPAALRSGGGSGSLSDSGAAGFLAGLPGRCRGRARASVAAKWPGDLLPHHRRCASVKLQALPGCACTCDIRSCCRPGHTLLGMVNVMSDRRLEAGGRVAHQSWARCRPRSGALRPWHHGGPHA